MGQLGRNSVETRLIMKGEVVYLYAFDVANEIITSRVPEILSEKPFPFEIRMDRTLPKDMPLYKPLAIEPPALATRLQGSPVRLLIRIYDVGVVTVMMRVAFAVDGPGDLMPFHNPKLEDGLTLDTVAVKLCAEVCDNLKDSIVGRAEFPPPEAYTVFCLTDLGGATDANAWLAGQRRAVAGLLTETMAEKLSDAQVAEVLRIQRSFENTDLAVIDWDAALVVDLTGYVDDVLYALELANLQLEEFRVMDARLDKYLDRAYADLEHRTQQRKQQAQLLETLKSGDKVVTQRHRRRRHHGQGQHGFAPFGGRQDGSDQVLRWWKSSNAAATPPNPERP
jgi:hypothetical protein